MPFPPDGFQKVAEALNSSQLPTGEGRQRTIAGRCYYAAFLTVREAIRVRHQLTGSYDPHHNDVTKILSSDLGPNTDVRLLGSYLGELKLQREKADYHLERVTTESDAERCVELVQLAAKLVPTVAKDLPLIN